MEVIVAISTFGIPGIISPRNIIRSYLEGGSGLAATEKNTGIADSAETEGRPLGDEKSIRWVRDALSHLTIPGSEGDHRHMAMSVEFEVSESPKIATAPSVHYEEIERYGPGHHFLSRMDRQYIKALLAIGYAEDAADLLQKAYKARLQETRVHGTEDRPPLTIFDLEYVEMLLIVGQRRLAVDFVLRLMEEFELASAGAMATTQTRSRLKREYEATMRAIEVDGRLPPEEEADESEEPEANMLRRLLGVLLGRERTPS